jgi:hypothetical protein
MHIMITTHYCCRTPFDASPMQADMPFPVLFMHETPINVERVRMTWNLMLC